MSRNKRYIDQGTDGALIDRVVCGEPAVQHLPEKRGTVAHSCTRKYKHPGTHYDEVTDTWFGFVESRGWLFFERTDERGQYSKAG